MSVLRVVTLSALLAASWAVAAEPPVHRVYMPLLNPREYPNDARRAVKPPSWETFGNQTQFATLRGFNVTDGAIMGYNETLDQYTKTFDLGRVVWPSYPIVFAKNLQELADAIKARDLYLFDIWGYVPGSGPGDYWQQYSPSPEALAVLENTLGERWLGMDVGEQDGRYIGGYADQAFPVSENRFEQYLNFQRHFERMGDDLGNKLSTLVSLNFGHYFLKEGTYTAIGAETAQALPNSQVYYAFIRGAGKQYGVPWFGNASVFNRWGYKNYDSTAEDHGPTKGSSLNLLKRLLYSHILYNSVFVGFESGWTEKNELSPIGRIQQSAQRWVRENGSPGTMQTPVALLFDFYAGWTFPRHLYTEHAYRVWSNIPYGPGDYLANDVLEMIYPGYQNASYCHDESGFLAPTPYGDSADCLLSDAPETLLARYPLVIAVSALSGGAELRDTLTGYVRGGGHLVVTAGNLARFPEGLCGVAASADRHRIAANTPLSVGGREISETAAFDAHTLTYPQEAAIPAQCDGQAMAVEAVFGEGRITVLSSDFGIPGTAQEGKIDPRSPDATMHNPYPLLAHVRMLLDAALREQSLFEAGDGLSLIVCRNAPGDYTLGLSNNSLDAKPFAFISHCGPIESVAELPLDQSEKGAVGYLPEGLEGAAIGVSGDGVIAGGDVRIFRVKVREEGVTELPHMPFPAPSKGRVLPLRGAGTLKEQILARPTFFAHYDGVLADWRYLHDRDRDALKQEAAWLGRQGVRVYVDLSSGVNLYPDLRLIENDPKEFATSMAVVDDVLEKMAALGARDLIVTPNRVPENSYTWPQTKDSFTTTLKLICEKAAPHNITVYLRVSTKLTPNIETNMEFITGAGAPLNLFLAPSTAILIHKQSNPADVDETIKKKIGLWLAAAPQYDIRDTFWTMNAPIHTLSNREAVTRWTELTPDAPVVFDAVYENGDEEYLDISFFVNQ